MTLTLVKNPDIVASVGHLTHNRPYVVGFAAETQKMEEYARHKLIQKNLDMIYANSISLADHGLNSETNVLHLFWQDKNIRLPKNHKLKLSHSLLDEILQSYEKKNRAKNS